MSDNKTTLSKCQRVPKGQSSNN